MKVPDEYIITRSDEWCIDNGYWWDEDAAQRPVRFIQQYVIPTRGPSADTHVTLIDWQRHGFRRLMGWKKPDGRRRFRFGSLFIPRQNGKSFFASCLALYMLMADREPGAYVVVSAVTGEQTKVIFNEVLNSVRQSPALLDAVVCRPSTREIYYPKTNSVLKGLSNEGWGKLGNPPHCAVLDEFAFWQSYKPYEALKTGMDSRRQPLLFTISTSGTDRSTPAYDVWQYAQAVQDGAVVDSDFFPMVYAAKPTDDIHDPDVWKAANPSLGFTVPVEETGKWATRAKRSKVEELQFRQFRLNQWCASVNQFLDLDAWQDCKVDQWPDLDGKDAYVAADLSTSGDLTSVVTTIPHQGGFYTEHHSFCCRAGVERNESKQMVKYSMFENEGTLTVHDGNSIDFQDVRDYIRGRCEKYKVRAIAFDPSHNANDTMLMLAAEGLPVEQYRQGPLYFNQPMRRLSELVMDRKLCHRGDSLANWQAQNLESKKDHRDLLRPTKPSDDAKIDMMVALLMSLALALRGQAQPEDTGSPLVWI